MCKCLAGNVACCCFNCALNVLVSIISAFLVIFIIVGLIVYFVYYYEKEDEVTKLHNDIQDGIKNTFDNLKNKLSP
ncbi:protein midgut expression 1 [Drosophila grimshawi]|uniref:protein midgut expression 1 n=1 Tax=Drosophila grimshawi TaxID=7222 RepID=UPI000C86E53A|nr:protein midgut expression 1 [Drosophila grimshawi]